MLQSVVLHHQKVCLFCNVSSNSKRSPTTKFSAMKVTGHSLCVAKRIPRRMLMVMLCYGAVSFPAILPGLTVMLISFFVSSCIRLKILQQVYLQALARVAACKAICANLFSRRQTLSQCSQNKCFLMIFWYCSICLWFPSPKFILEIFSLVSSL